MRDERGKRYLPLLPVAAAGVIAACAIFVGGFYLGSTAPAQGVPSGTSGMPAQVDFSPVWKAWHIIDQQYVPVSVASSTPVAATTSEASDQARVWGMVSGLVNSLQDPYSYFLPPTENKAFSADMSGSFDGVGMEIEIKNKVLTVVSPLKGTPADRAGIKSGDQILKIDGTSTAGMSVNTAVKDIRGPKGTQVTLTVMRSSWSSPRDLKVTRAVINVPIVTTSEKPGGIFVISLAEFTSNAPDLFRQALRTFIESGDTKLILDLRGNPGGYLQAAVDIASWFLPSGDKVVTEDFAGHQPDITHRSLGYDVFNKNLRMVILVDRGTASAAEILSGALRYYGVAKLVGTHTYGKGSVQELFPITPDTSLKLTVARWLPPDGKPIPQDGLAPDVQVNVTDAEVAAGKDPQMQKAIELLNGQ